MTNEGPLKSACTLFVVLAALSVAMSAQTFSTLASFDNQDGANPTTPLIQGIDGNFYGASERGGGAVRGCSDGTCGALFGVTRTGALAGIGLCEGLCPLGALPLGSPLLGIDLNFYATTTVMGPPPLSRGTIFKLNAKGADPEIYPFCQNGGSCPDGYSPEGALTLGADRNFYGTANGGGNGFGTVFKITPNGTLTTLYRFCTLTGCNGDGQFPATGVIQATNGNLYGTTSTGGIATNCGFSTGGTVFGVTPVGNERVLHQFGSSPGCADGVEPEGALVQGLDGNFYGTTFYGGSFTGTICQSAGCGTLFKLTPTGILTTLYNFCTLANCSDGANPSAALIQATDGNFYGATQNGGLPNCTGGCGTLFRITPNGTLTTLYSFCSQASCVDGFSPQAALLQATDGNFYGLTFGGGTSSNCFGQPCGTVFRLSMGLGPFVAFVHDSGPVGQTMGILGQGLTGTTNLSFNGIPATFTVVSDTLLDATVPTGATTGYVTVNTPGGTLTSNTLFYVLQ